MGVISYIKSVWTDRAVQYPNRYDKTLETSGSVTLVPNAGTVTQAGTPINAAKLNNLENGVAAALPAGTVNSDISLLKSMLIETDTRGIYLTRNTAGQVTSIEERDGSTVIRTSTLTYTNDNLTTVVEVAGGKTVTRTMNYDTAGNVASTTKTVV